MAHPSRRAAPTGPSPRCAPRPADRRAAPRRRRSPPGPWECAAPPGRSDDRRGSRPHRVAAPAQIGACFRDGGAAEVEQGGGEDAVGAGVERLRQMLERPDRKSTRLNSSHLVISYAVFCLKKKKKK